MVPFSYYLSLFVFFFFCYYYNIVKILLQNNSFSFFFLILIYLIFLDLDYLLYFLFFFWEFSLLFSKIEYFNSLFGSRQWMPKNYADIASKIESIFYIKTCICFMIFSISQRHRFDTFRTYFISIQNLFLKRLNLVLCFYFYFFRSFIP